MISCGVESVLAVEEAKVVLRVMSLRANSETSCDQSFSLDDAALRGVAPEANERRSGSEHRRKGNDWR